MVDLPKWPAFHVQGDSVSKETAMDFILRTDSSIHSFISGNNHRFKDWFLENMGWKKFESFVNDVTEHFAERFAMQSEFSSLLGYVDLGDIPSDNICSSVIHGPRGFINADGTVFHKHNIGKWPDAIDVENSLGRIVDNWGVKFKATLYDDESCELSSDSALKKALITFVSDGEELKAIPNPSRMEEICFVGAQSNDEMHSALMNILGGGGNEQGVCDNDLKTYIFPKTNQAINQIIDSFKVEGK